MLNIEQLRQEIEKLSTVLNEKDWHAYDIFLLNRLMLRCQEFILQGCDECSKILDNIASWVAVMKKNNNVPKEQEIHYFHFLNNSKRHMFSDHKLVSKRQYLVATLPVFLILGLLSGWILGNIGIGALIGVAAGIAFGVVMDLQSARKNKII
ncbi:MAG: hypothetical protein FWF37_00535 [Chloroflexi bacterium]|nr:hypothetical protein [Chloroflexota bacterium]